LIGSPFHVVFAGAISCDAAEAISLVSFSSTSSQPFFNVPMTLLKAEKAAAGNVDCKSGFGKLSR